MNRIVRSSVSRVLRHSTIRIVAVLALATFALSATAASAAVTSAAPLDKHARRIEKRLAKFREGTILDFEFRDSSQTFGSLGPLSAASFQFTDSDSNKTQTHLYSDLVEVKKSKEYIGDGSVHHHVRLLVPIIIGAGVAAGGITAYEVLH